MLRTISRSTRGTKHSCFNGHPPLGVNATSPAVREEAARKLGFNGHPPLGVNATVPQASDMLPSLKSFNGHPPLGVNATNTTLQPLHHTISLRFNGHPPLGVNATCR